ncbi:hypothetical protein BTVI_34378 [Pitangus sulphuratus]|nr:hypothetical protein BTVI_34378 [Pitangus sulphuratus]
MVMGHDIMAKSLENEVFANEIFCVLRNLIIFEFTAHKERFIEIAHSFHSKPNVSNHKVIHKYVEYMKWKLAITGIPQWSVLGSALFNIFVGDMDSGTEYTLNTLPTTPSCCAVNMLEGRDAIQIDFDRFEWWAYANLMKFSKAK